MKSLIQKFWILLFGAALFSSCGTVEEYVLLNDLDTDTYYKMQIPDDLHIKRGDELRIVVTHKLPQITEMFNQKINSLEGGETLNTFVVNTNGYINFPFFDTIKAEGLTCSELEHHIADKIEESGLANNPTVNVKITNFKVTVIGESGTGILEFDDEKVTIFDLVAKANLAQSGSGGAGGMGIRRDKILIMREINGVLHSEYVSLLTKDIFYSPYYYLQQNDVIYVWPSQETIRNSNHIFDWWWQRLSIVTTAVSTITLFLTLFNKKTSN